MFAAHRARFLYAFFIENRSERNVEIKNFTQSQKILCERGASDADSFFGPGLLRHLDRMITKLKPLVELQSFAHKLLWRSPFIPLRIYRSPITTRIMMNKYMSAVNKYVIKLVFSSPLLLRHTNPQILTKNF